MTHDIMTPSLTYVVAVAVSSWCRYTSKSILRSKLLYAISNCQSIDGDATHEGRANMMMAWGDEDEEEHAQ